MTILPATLQSIFDAHLSRGEVKTVTRPTNNEDDESEAERWKDVGNTLMTGKNYNEAIEAYTKAIAKCRTNPVYYSNRAAAHSSQKDYLSAIADAQIAIDIDRTFVKAYHRQGQVS